MFIFEIRTLRNNNLKILKALRFENKFIIDPINHCGGIWILWNNNKLDLINYCTTFRSANLQVNYKPLKQHMLFLDIYVQPKNMIKINKFWDNLHSFIMNATIPWITIAYFNEMLSMRHKMVDLYDQINLSDYRNSSQILMPPIFRVNKQGSLGKKIQNQIIYERLDKAIANHQCNAIFPRGTAFYANFTISDHAPVIYDSKTQNSKPIIHFRFQITSSLNWRHMKQFKTLGQNLYM